MNIPSYREVQNISKCLSQSSWTTYRKILGRLVQEHDHIELVRPISGLLRNQNIRGLVEYADFLSTLSYVDHTSHFVCNQFASLIKKYPFPDQTIFDPRKSAREKFLLSEERCSSVNKDFLSNNMKDIEGTLHTMRNFISYVLGPFDFTRVIEFCDVGPGASIGVSGNATNIFRKFSKSWSVTPSALHYAFASIKKDWNLLRVLCDAKPSDIISMDNDELFDKFIKRCSVVQHNKIAFVPKTVKTHRVIAVEPLLNTWLQKGVDNVIRRRLRRINIDLSNQSINSVLSQKGSENWKSEDPLVTIDLSSASDSISTELCRSILPYDWFDYLNSIRSKKYLLDDEISTYSKFCSQGNGFCFPLETLIFVASAHACGARNPGIDFHIYGDDIVCKRSVALKLIPLLERLGFSTNSDKTFVEGPFRESCGTDWFGGKDVRPFVLDFSLDTLENIFKWLNLTRRNSRTEFFFSGVRDFVKSRVPSQFIFWRPYEGPPDTGVTLSSFDLDNPYFEFKNSQYWWYELKSRPCNDKVAMYSKPAINLATLAIIRGSPSDNIFPLRRKTRTTVVRVKRG